MVASYLDEHEDAARTGELVKGGERFLAVPGDICDPQHRVSLVQRTVAEFGHLDILVNNAAFQQPVDRPEDLTPEQWQRTFATNIEATFFLTQAALAHMGEGCAVINTALDHRPAGTQSPPTTPRPRAPSSP